jgi:hypothetical protein
MSHANARPMSTVLPVPLSLPWELKPVSSAKSGFQTLADGRRCFSLENFLPQLYEREVALGGNLTSKELK